ncbi:hypothetical protein [Streptomyces syringium]|uniref:hypothetical protein n=1 Tax=Streptomyces syringium TaxID=76729 RepID=UPI0033D51244
MKPMHRILATAAATLLLGIGSAAISAPAHADAHLNVGGLIGADANGTIDLTGPDGSPILTLPNVLSPVV